VIVSIFISWLSWRFVEMPMRRTGTQLSFSKVFVQRFIVPLVALVSIGGAMAYTNGFPQRFDPRVVDLEVAVDSKPNILRNGCHVPTALYATLPSEKCRLGSEKQKIDGILVGDSFANHFSGMIDVMARAQEISLVDYTMDGCPPILGYDTGKEPSYREKCLRRNELVYENIAKNHYSRVVLAGNWPKNKKAGDQLRASIDIVLGTGAKLTLVLSNEKIDRASSCSIRRIMYGAAASDDCEGPREDAPSYLKEIISHYPQIKIIDPNLIICSEKRCSPMLDETLIYRDDAHLNDIGSRLLGERMLERGVAL